MINLQGFMHFQDGLNNQDYVVELPKFLLVLDGCSGGKFSEVGSRIFAQLFKTLNNYDKLEFFESNVEYIFKKIKEQYSSWFANEDDLDDFLLDNFIFTIIACFELEDKFVVKIFGDGYIITQNINNVVSYIKLSYGRTPPYYVYKLSNKEYLNMFKEKEFKTFEFSKKDFNSVGIASDGILPLAKGRVKGIDAILFDSQKNCTVATILNGSRIMFGDDTSIAVFYKGKCVPSSLREVMGKYDIVPKAMNSGLVLDLY